MLCVCVCVCMHMGAHLSKDIDGWKRSVDTGTHSLFKVRVVVVR